jgi:hypothetical protein
VGGEEGVMADWHIWCPDRGEERGDSARVWRGYDSPEEAAESWAQQSDWDSAEFDIVGGRNEPEVLVAPVDESAEPVRLVVTGESVPCYTARRAR